MGIITKGGRITGSTSSLSRKMRGQKSGSSRSGGGTTAISKPKYSAPKTISPMVNTGSTASRMLAGVNINALTDEQKKLLQKKGISVGGKSSPTLSAQGQANVAELVRKFQESTINTSQAPGASNAAKGVQGALGLALGTSLKAPAKLEFSVLPGAQSGRITASPLETLNAAQSTIAGRTQAERDVAAKASAENVQLAKNLANVAAFAPIPAGAVAKAGAVVGSGVKSAGILSKIKKIFGTKQTATAINALEKTAAAGSTEARSLLQQLVRGGAQVARGTAATATRVAAPVATAVSNHKAISTLGAAVVSYSLGGAMGEQAATQAGQVRNAVPAATGESTPTPQSTAERVATQTPAQAIAQDIKTTPTTNSVVAPDTLATNSGTSQHLSSSTTGQRASGAVVGEPQYAQTGAAGARDINFQRSQVDQSGVITPIGTQVDVANLDAIRQRTQDLLQQHGADAVTMPEFKEGVNAMLQAGVENLRKLQPTPPVPVVDTAEQVDWLSQIQDPVEQFNQRAFMDQTRQALGMPDLESQKIDTMQKLQAVQETYQRVIDDIKKNPNLPKGLAARRLTEVFEDQKFAASSLLAQLDIIDDQLEQANNRLNQEIGLFQSEQAAAERAYQRRVDQFGFLVDSGAIGGLSEQEMAQWSSVTGIPIQAVRQMKQNALTPDVDYATSFQTDNNGNVTMITYDKNNPLNVQTQNLGSLGKRSSTGEKKANPLTLSEVEKFGLPYTFVGATEDDGAQFLDDIQSSTPPDWFVKSLGYDTSKLTTQAARNLVQQSTQSQWDSYRSEFGPKDDDTKKLEKALSKLAG